VSELGDLLLLAAICGLVTVASWGTWRGWFSPYRVPLVARLFYLSFPAALGFTWFFVVALVHELGAVPEGVLVVATIPAFVLKLTSFALWVWQPRWLMPDWELRYERELHRLRLAQLDELDRADGRNPLDPLDLHPTRQVYEAFDDLRSIEARERLEDQAAVELAAIEASREKRQRRRRR
jgi:hypothetical protein